jgi:4-hydroxy-3-methylbut-2-enyl diphosphate reductase
MTDKGSELHDPSSLSPASGRPLEGTARPLEVILANPRGFCAGVVRAIEVVERALEREQAPVYVRHEIVHNRHVVEKLRRKGAIFVDELSEIPTGALTIFSAHGVARTVEEEAERRGLPVIDATCPLVTKVHVQGRRYAKAGRTMVLIGHEGHAEVEGTMGQINAPVLLVSSPEDVAALTLPDDTPVAYVTQTTLSVDDTRAVIAALEARFSDVTGPNVSEICYATQNRQSAVRDLARVSDLVIVVGAANSSNSRRLREIGVEMNIPSYLVDDGEGVDPAWLDGVEAVGITAGASAPDELVESVIDALRRLRDVRVSQLDGAEENIQFALPPQLRGPRQSRQLPETAESLAAEAHSTESQVQA